MGYNSIVDKQFIKISENNYLPMVMSADSNLREFHNNAMVRSWFAMQHRPLGEPYGGSLEYFMKEADETFQEELERSEEFAKKYNPDNIPGEKLVYDEFGSHRGLFVNGNRCTTFGMYKGIWKTGCRKALTIEEIKVIVPGFHVTLKSYEGHFQFVASSTEQLQEGLKKLLPYELQNRDRVYASINLSEGDCRFLRRAYWNKKSLWTDANGNKLSKLS